MRTKSDAELLNEYATARSEAAFREIVRRYADAVYSAALRQVGNDAQARDVAQTVFVDLARKAASLGANTLLIGWLHRGARLAALELLRKEQRRQNRERQAMELFDPASDASNDWNVVRPVLDEAVASLGDVDRHALLLRFFQNENLASVGATLGVSEDAAQKRVSRALDKLREFLAERGINTTAAALAVTLTANAVQSAPVNFAATLSGGALAKTALVGSSTPPMLKLLTVTNMKTALLVLTMAGGLAAVTVVRVQSQHRLREAQALVQQQADEIAALLATNEQLTGLTNQMADLREEAKEVLRLRAEVTQMRREINLKDVALAKSLHAQTTNNSPDQPARQINVRVKFILASEQLFAGSRSLEVISESQYKNTMESLANASTAKELAQCNITTLSGRQAATAFSMNGNYTNIDLSFGFAPTCATNSVAINLDSMRLSLEEWTDPAPPDGRSPPRFLPAPTQLKTRNHFNYDGLVSARSELFSELALMEITDSISVPDGQTLLLQKKLPNTEAWSSIIDNTSAEPRTLVLLLTPTEIDAAGNRLEHNIHKVVDNSVDGRSTANPSAP